MNIIDTEAHRGFFDVVASTDRSQAATMVLSPGQSTGGPENRHRNSDQWLFVQAGSGVATVGGETYQIEAGDLLLIEPGEAHEIHNDGEEPLTTINVYAPPEY
ncbi:cupin domain-containing protein [Halopenitus sp. H-Gu1]|uniref:cupin domain-containing protein n=1 Tax=Halopenitus sp. H-Gu1 TaxID=3242697 RepID=UPI00359E3037